MPPPPTHPPASPKEQSRVLSFYSRCRVCHIYLLRTVFSVPLGAAVAEIVGESRVAKTTPLAFRVVLIRRRKCGAKGKKTTKQTRWVVTCRL